MRMRMLSVLLIAGLSLALAQEKMDHAKMETGKKDSKPAASPMSVPQIEEMAKLEKAFAGTWSLDEKFEPMPGMPGMDKGGTGKGTEVIKRGPNGNSLVSDLKSTSTMGPFTGHGLMWWDAKAGGYRMVWCDSATPMCDAGMLGKWQGNDLVVEGDSEMPPEQGGGKMHMVQKFTEITPNSFTFTIDSSMNGGPMTHMMTIKYKRVGGKKQ
jgi:hypothetical protein